MPTATVELPTLLGGLVGTDVVHVEAATLREALEDAFRRHPSLRVHILDETGALRRHVLCLHNGANTRWYENLEVALREGDRLTILQAVSGG